MILCLNVFNLFATTFTGVYRDEPMPNVLRDIDRAYTGGNINFIFNELEDFTVTAEIKSKPIMDVVYEVVGFYPIKVTRVKNDIYLECLRKESSKLKGRLLDENMNPVEYANVHLFNPSDTTFITSGVSNANGDFVIPCDAKEVLLKMTCIGYMPYSKIYKVGRIGTIRLHTNAKVLKEVKVENRHIVYNGDNITAYPTTLQVENSYDLYSLLNQQPFPGLYVNEWEQTISVFGGSPVIIINGVKRAVKDLVSIQPKNVKKIEYSMVVPMKYQGASGVIYIYLKDPKAAGGSFYSNVQSALTTGFINGEAGASYNQGKSQFTLDYSFDLRDYNSRVVDIEQSYIGDNFKVDLKEQGEESSLYYDEHLLRMGYNYRHDKSTLFSMVLNNTMFSGTTEENGFVYDSYIGNYKRTTSKDTYYYMPSLDLYFQKEIAGGHILEAQVVGTFTDYGYERAYSDLNEAGETFSYPSKVNTEHKSIVSEVSYSKKLERTSIQAGIKNELSKSENSYVHEDYKSDLEKNDNYIYLNLSQRIGKMSLNVGTGLKYINMRSELNEHSFTRNVTTISFTGSPKSHFYVALNGSYSPVFPSLSSLTELEQTSNGYLSINGNPELKTGHSLKGRLALSPSFGHFGIVLVNMVNYIIDPQYTQVSYIGGGKFLKRSENYDNYFHYQANVAFTMNEVMKKHLTARVELYYNHYRTKANLWKHHLNSLGLYCSLKGYFGKWNVDVNYLLQHKNIEGEVVSTADSGPSISVGWHPNKHWFFKAGCQFLFNSKGTMYTEERLSAANPYKAESYIKDNANMFTISARYTVSFGKLFGKTKRTLYNNSSGVDVMTL